MRELWDKYMPLRRTVWGLAFAVVFFVGIGIGTSSQSDAKTAETVTVASKPKTETVTKTKTVTTVVTKTKVVPAKPKATFGDGSYLVGKDVPAGTYYAPGGDTCYWQRSSDASGSDIIANDLSSGGQVTMSVNRGEYIQTRGCGEWSPR